MERLTKYWGNGEYGLINAFKTTNAEVCNALGRYEDEAERREKGCSYCNGCLSCYEVAECPFRRELTPETCSHYEPRFEFCPKCGRKLVQEEAICVSNNCAFLDAEGHKLYEDCSNCPYGMGNEVKDWPLELDYYEDGRMCEGCQWGEMEERR